MWALGMVYVDTRGDVRGRGRRFKRPRGNMYVSAKVGLHGRQGWRVLKGLSAFVWAVYVREMSWVRE